MFSCVTVSSTSAARARRSGGQALMAVLGVLTMLGIMVSLALTLSTSTKNGTAREGRTQAAIQAADSAINRYVSRLVEDPYYYMHIVDQAEDVRTANGVAYGPGSNYAQAGVFNWTYSGPPQNFAYIGEGPYGAVQYSLRVEPSINGLTTKITATGRVTGLPAVNNGTGPQPVAANAVTRTVEATISPESVAGYQLISESSANYGSLTNGKIYVKGNFSQGFNTNGAAGFSRNSVYATGFICNNNISCTSSAPSATWYNIGNNNPVLPIAPEYLASDTTPPITSRFPTDIDFSRFSANITSIRDYAVGAGTAFIGGPETAYMLKFSANGTYQVWAVTGNYQNWVATTPVGVVYTPIGGARTLQSPVAVLYFDKPVIVGDSSRAAIGDSVVDGRVTVASTSDITIGGNLGPEVATDDVIGLIAKDNITFANTLPTQAVVNASLLAQTQDIQSATDPSQPGHCNVGPQKPNSLLTYSGAQITHEICGFSMSWVSRNWSWDQNRGNFVPPLFPTLDGTYEIDSWREVTTPS
jgi:type II secretory pathway pseudopilin PulG